MTACVLNSLKTVRPIDYGADIVKELIGDIRRQGI